MKRSVPESWFEEGALVRPDWAQPNLVHLNRAIACWLHGDDLLAEHGWPADEATTGLGAVLDGAERVAHVLVDGLSQSFLERLPADAFLRTHLNRTLRTVLPSATTPALTSQATGEWPALHGMFGWYSYLPRRDRLVLSLPFTALPGEVPADRAGVPFGELFFRPALLARNRPAACALFPSHLLNGRFNLYSAGAARRVPYSNLDEAFRAFAEALRSRAERYVYLYLPHLDSHAHKHGCEKLDDLLTALNAGLEQAARALSPRTRLLVTADHGLVDSVPELRFALDETSPLMDTLVAPPAGEPAMPFFHVRGDLVDRFLEHFEDSLGKAFVLLDPAACEELQLFGPVPLGPVARERVGQFVGIAREAAWVQAVPAGGQPYPLVGVHGGLRPDEVFVPLVVV